MADYNLGRAHGEIVIDTDKAEKGFDRAEAAQAAFRDSTDESSESLSRNSSEAEKSGKAHDRNNKSLFKAVAITTLFATALKLVKFPAMVAGANLAVQAVGALTAGVIALVSALGPMVGLVGAMPGLYSAAAQAMGVVKLATSGLSDELKALQKAAGEPFVAQGTKDFAKFLFGLTPQLNALKTASAGMWDGVESGIRRLLPLFPILEQGVAGTAQKLGWLADQAGISISSWGPDLQTILAANTNVIGNFGIGAINLADALRHVMVAAIPLVTWISELVAQVGLWASDAALAGRESGRLADFFQRAAHVAAFFGGILADVGKALFNTFSAGNSLGNDLLSTLQRLAERWRQWTESVAGQNALRAFFDEARPALTEIGLLVGDIARGFSEMGGGAALADIVRLIRAEILPALIQLAQTTGELFTQELISTAGSFIRLLTTMSTESGPLTIFVRVLGMIADAISAIVSSHPAVANMVYTFGILNATFGAFKLASIVTGFGKLAPLLLGAGRAIMVVVSGMRALGVAFTLNPVGLLVTALIAAAALIYFNWDKIKAAFSTGVEWIRAHLSQIGTVVLALLTGGLSLVVGFIISHWEQIKAAFAAGVAWIGQKLSEAGAFIAGIPGIIATAFSAAIAWAADFAVQLPNRIAYAVGAMIRFLLTMPGEVARWAADIGSKFAAFAADIVAKALVLGARWVDSIVRYLQQLPGKVASFLSNVLSNAASWASNMISRAVQMGSSFLSSVGSFLAQLPGRVGSFLSSALSTAASFPGRFASAAASMGSSMLSALSSGIAGIPGIISNVLSNAVSGIGAWGSRAAAAMRNLAAGMWSSFKAGLGISSPSFIERAMTAIGENVVDNTSTVAGQVKQLMSLGKELASTNFTTSPATAIPPAIQRQMEMRWPTGPAPALAGVGAGAAAPVASRSISIGQLTLALPASALPSIGNMDPSALKEWAKALRAVLVELEDEES